MYQFGKLNKGVAILGNIFKSLVCPGINLCIYIISK